jgi:hypothetical protein
MVLMRRTRILTLALSAAIAAACRQTPSSPVESDAATPAAGGTTTAAKATTGDLAYACPMDPDIRSNEPGKCPRCGMALVAGIPDPKEFHLDLTVTPNPPQPGQSTELVFSVFDPWKNNPVKKFTAVHEKLFHAFIVSRDLQFFAHDHPQWDDRDSFRLNVALPKPGLYRILGDFYPEAATPQLLNQSLFVAGPEPPAAKLARDYSEKQADNLQVGISVAPSNPIAGLTTQIRFMLTPGDGIEKYLGAWGHMLIASDDLIDMIHTHPFLADGSAEVQFKLIFPRARVYRMWVQFQRNGVINTAHFDIPVKPAPR